MSDYDVLLDKIFPSSLQLKNDKPTIYSGTPLIQTPEINTPQ